MRSQPHRSSHAARFGGFVLGMLLALVAGCGDENAPDAESLSLRELLGLAPERVATLDPDALSTFTQRLQTAMGPGEEIAHAVALPEAKRHIDALQPPLDFVEALDRGRARNDFAPLTTARLDASGFEATVHTTPLSLDDLGITESSARLIVRPLGDDEPGPVYEGVLHYEETSWGHVVVDALHGRTELEAIERVEPALRRFLGVTSVEVEAVQVVSAPRSPLVIWYASEHRALLVNPNILYLFAEETHDQPSGSAELRTQTQALTLDFIDACVDEERGRCNECALTEDPDAAISLCVPLFEAPLGANPVTESRRECEALASTEEGFERLCYNLFIDEHLSCILDSGVEQVCGLTHAPYVNVEELWLLDPMRTDERCQIVLQGCYQRQQQQLHPTPRPAPPPSAPDFPPVYQNDLDDDDSDFSLFCDTIVAIGSCDDAGDEATDDDTSSCGTDDDPSSDDDGGLCEGDDDDSSSDDDSDFCGDDDDTSTTDDSDDGGICDGDDESESTTDALRGSKPPLNGGDLFMALTLAFLGLVWRRASPPEVA